MRSSSSGVGRQAFCALRGASLAMRWERRWQLSRASVRRIAKCKPVESLLQSRKIFGFYVLLSNVESCRLKGSENQWQQVPKSAMPARRIPCANLYHHERGAAMSDKKQPGREEVRLLNIKEAARFLGTTDKTLYTKIWRREIPFIKIGRSVRFDVKDLEALIERSRIKAVAI